MSTATCPKCHRQVSVPTTDDHSVWVRCPLCSEQYSLRMALDHVPPTLEILGPGAEMAHGDLAMHGDAAAFGQSAMHGEMPAPADHAAGLAPLDAEHFMQADHGSNGEQPLDLEHDGLLEHPTEPSPGLNQANGQHQDNAEQLIDFDLDAGEHAEITTATDHGMHDETIAHSEPTEHLEDDPAAAAFGEFHGEHTIEPSSGEHSEGDPEFQIADGAAGEDAVDDASEEQHAMGGIATLVQAAPPARKRRQAPLMVKLIGVLVGLGFGLVGCYLVYGAFLWMHSDQFHLKQYFPAFLRNRVADEPAPPRHSKAPEKLTSGFVPVARPTDGTGNPATPPATQTAGPDTATNTPSPTASTGDTSTANAPPNKPAPTDVAQQSPDKSNAPLETIEDPSKAPPPSLDKPEIAKTDPTGIAPPKFDAPPATPFGDTKPPVGPKPAVDPSEKPSTEKPPEKTTDKPPVDTTEKPVPLPDKPIGDKPSVDKPTTDKPSTDKPSIDKPSIDKPENPATIPSTEKPVTKPAVENPTDIPAPSESKSPIAAQLQSVDSAITATTQAAESLKSAIVPGSARAVVLKASVANYKAMSHLVTELGAVDSAGADPDSAARIEQLRKKAAALAESMGSAAERDTTAMLASKWVASPSRKENGAVVVGTLVKVEPSDKGFIAHVKMPSDSKEMTFATMKKPTAADGSTVVVLGLLNADDGGTAIEIVSPNDEKAPATPAVEPPAKPTDADKPSTDKPAADKPADNKPATDKPADDKPVADKPVADKPGADKPADKAAPIAPEKPAENKAAPETTKPQ